MESRNKKKKGMIQLRGPVIRAAGTDRDERKRQTGGGKREEIRRVMTKPLSRNEGHLLPAQWMKNKTKQKKPSLGHVALTFLSSKDKVKILKASRERESRSHTKDRNSGGTGDNKSSKEGGLILGRPPYFRSIKKVV